MGVIKFFEDIPSETRREAHEKVDKNKRYRQIIACLANSNGMTAKEIAVAMRNKGEIPTSERNFVSPRITELRQQDKVEIVGKKVCQYTGHKVAIFALRREI